ncbi:hypothetical protein CSUI_007739 [Cystoisospora suis]|uniref:Uncharacterized protein n=1 Tax=Cystoisospora suis TaxID=483139 RepID=A0A2C6KPW5_9APIC|nr:hypothetical protein CSUI_007739 [Cystoisospora suis]
MEKVRVQQRCAPVDAGKPFLLAYIQPPENFPELPRGQPCAPDDRPEEAATRLESAKANLTKA